MGERVKRVARGGGISWPGSGVIVSSDESRLGASGAVFASIRSSDLAAFEIDARIDPGISEVGDQLHEQAKQRKDVERREHDRIIAVHQALEAEQAQAVERENSLDQERASEEG